VVHNPPVDRAGPERGATAVTYAVMVAIIALLLAGGVFVLFTNIETSLTNGAECVANPSDCEGSGGGGGGGDNGGGTGGGSSTTSTTQPSPTSTTTGG
jgi:Flp pilus assembly pilin Flp